MKKKTIVGLIATVVIVLVIFAGCVEKDGITPSAPTPSKPPVTEGLGDKNILIVIAPKDFRDEELFKPKEVFKEKGMKVTIASTSTDTAKGMLGGTVKPNLKISDVNIDEYDAIVIVGGVGSKEYLWGDEDLRTLVKEAYTKNKIVSAICLSPVVLARAGILEGKQATVFPDREAIDELKRNGANYLDRSVVVSDRVITGRDPESAEEFALKIWDTLVKIGHEGSKETPPASAPAHTLTPMPKEKTPAQPDPYFPASVGRISSRVNVEYTYDALGRPLGGIVREEVANKGGSGDVFVSVSRGPMGGVGTYEGSPSKVFHMDEGERVIVTVYFEGLRASGYGSGEEVRWTVRPALPTDSSDKNIRVIRVGTTVEALVESLKDKDDFVREVAARALGDLRDKRATDVLINVLKDKDESVNVRNSAANALGKIGDERAIESLIKAGYVFIASEKGKPAVEHLIKALEDKDEDTNIRRNVAEAFGRMYVFQWSMVPKGDSKVYDRTAQDDEKALRNYLKDEFNAEWVESAKITKIDKDKAIVISSGPNWVEIRLNYYRDKATMKLSDGRTREFKVGMYEGEPIVYSCISDTRVVESLIRALKDKDWGVRNNAARTLGCIGDKRAVEPLIETLKEDEYDFIRITAVHALGDIGGNTAVDALIKALENKNRAIRINAVEALGRIGDKKAVEPLITVLRKDEDKSARWWAIYVLGRIGDKRAVDPLIEALKDERWEIRQGAAYALGSIGDKRAVKALVKALEDENENVRIAADYALKMLK